MSRHRFLVVYDVTRPERRRGAGKRRPPPIANPPAATCTFATTTLPCITLRTATSRRNAEADRRRAKVHKTLLGFGDHVQSSVFLCDLNEREFVQLRTRLREHINQAEDQILLVDLGPAEREPLERIEALGLAFAPPERVQIV